MTRLLLLLLPLTLTQAAPPTPAETYGELFQAVQMDGVFPDQKEFVDCIPRRPPAEILSDYQREKHKPGFDLAAFVRANFTTAQTETIRTHIEALWGLLSRQATQPPENSSLLALPRPYVVPGGRFQELYYWDSYFVMLGLMESRKVEAVRHMVENFAHLIDTYGFIPNANRSYYLSRSQPPFFSLMLDLLAEHEGDQIYREFRPALEKEYRFWMDETRGHAVKIDGVVLNRYYDAADTPREESYAIDLKNAQRAPDARAFYRHIRSAAESGWDFSSRWFTDPRDIATIRTTNILPVDLNCLLHHLELTLAKARQLDGDQPGATAMIVQADQRRQAINTLFWSEKDAWYLDYDLITHRPTAALTLAGMMPFFLEVAPKDRITPAAKTLETKFLRPGGVVTTLQTTGEQWDAPNGWAPLQWITIAGLRNYGQMPLAETIARRWMKQNLAIYESTGKLTEKYDVIDLTRPGGGGEYDSQDGFGWTNGVLLKLMNLYGAP